MAQTPVSRAVVVYAVGALDAALDDLTASSGTASSHDAALDRIGQVRRMLNGELLGGCPHLLVPVNRDLSDDAPMRCTYCGDVFDPRTTDPTVLAAGRDAGQAEDEATKREGVTV